MRYAHHTAPIVARGAARDECAVFGCGLQGVLVRAAESGFSIRYCDLHYTQANRLFGWRKNAERFGGTE